MRVMSCILLGLLLIPRIGLTASPDAWISVRVDEPPIVDGRLGDAAWQSCQWLTRFHRLGSDLPAEIESVGGLLHDADNLYVAMLMRKRPGETLSGRPLWHGDNVEIFLDPGRTRTAYYHLAANHRETFFSSPGEGTDWKPGVEVVAMEQPYGWVLECAIPIESLGIGAMDPHPIVAGNLCRTDPVHGHATAAVLDGASGFHQPARFLPIRFANAAEVPPRTPDVVAQEADHAEEAFRQHENAAREAIRSLTGCPEIVSALDVALRERVGVADRLKDGGDQSFPGNLGRKWLMEDLKNDLATTLDWRIKTAMLFDPPAESPAHQ